MKQTNVVLLITVLLSTVLVLTGCHYHRPYSPGRGYGPPPHAPAHGYRAKQHGHDLVYDSSLGVYVVVGLPGVYYHDGLYYRYRDDHWYYSGDLDRDWRDYGGDRRLPPGLAKKHGGGKGKGRGRGNPH